MTDDRLTTTNAIEYLRDRVQEVPEPAERSWDILVDGGALALALAEFDAARARVPALEAIVREMLPHLEWAARFDEDQAALVKRARELVGGKVHDEL